MRYLGIDYGSKRVGLSISDEEGKMAFPYKILVNNLELDDSIHNICGQEEISAIVLGESYNQFGQKNKIMGSIEEFKRNIETELGIPVYLEKEFMTTVFAREMMAEASGFFKKTVNSAKKTAKSKIDKADASAATLILQRFLDRKNSQ
jgi:putative Holliday junction resolvase